MDGRVAADLCGVTYDALKSFCKKQGVFPANPKLSAMREYRQQAVKRLNRRIERALRAGDLPGDIAAKNNVSLLRIKRIATQCNIDVEVPTRPPKSNTRKWLRSRANEAAREWLRNPQDTLLATAIKWGLSRAQMEGGLQRVKRLDQITDVENTSINGGAHGR